MTTFLTIHLILGIWLAIVNFTPIMEASSLAINNVIVGVIIAVYNAYYLLPGEVLKQRIIKERAIKADYGEN